MQDLLYAIVSLCEPINFLLMTLGVVIGIIFGAIPGLSAMTGMALCLPITFGMQPIGAFALLCGIYIGGVSGGLISAILLNIPGAPASVATTFDGAPMARNGQAGKALGIGIFCSFLGGLCSFVVLVFVAPPLAKIALTFTPCEYFSLAVLALSLISAMAGESVPKGLFSALLGMSFAMVGMAPIDGAVRFTFGMVHLNSGIDILPVLVGLFAISELINLAEKPNMMDGATAISYQIKGLGFTIKEFVEQIPNFMRSMLIGLGVGILPGIGGSTSNILSYVVAKKQSKYPEKFGTGIIDGIVASETANNASIGGAFVPLLCLGIPGDAVTAILLGGLTLHGLVPGPLLFKTSANVVYAIFAALLISNLIMLVLEYAGLRVFVRVLKIPAYYLMPIILSLCAVGAFSLNNRIFDIWILLFFGLVSYFMNKADIPLPPFILGFIMGPLVEINLRRGYMMGDGSFHLFFTRPISLIFLLITAFSLIWAFAKSKRKTSIIESE